MAYTPKTWVCGEKITDAGLNNIEEGIQEALEGGGSSLPDVTATDNGKVLTVVSGAWAKADKDFVCDGDDVDVSPCFEKAVESLLGYECSETELLSETVTTLAEDLAELSSHLALSEDVLTITFDGVEYECSKKVFADMMGTSNLYGGNITQSGPDFSEYPFIVQSLLSLIDPSAANNNLWAKDAGEHTVKVEIQAVSTTECFEKAVKSVVDTGFECVDEIAFDGSLTTTGVEREATIPYNKLIDAETIVVEFNGTKYELARDADADTGGSHYEASDNSFKIKSYRTSDGTLRNELVTATTGTYTIKITIPKGRAVTTDCFKTAVKSVVGDVDKGYECTETLTGLFDGSVTTEDVGEPDSAWGSFPSGTSISADLIKMTFNGTAYECENIGDGPDHAYGAPRDPDTDTIDFSVYPFRIYSGDLYTPTAGTYTIKVESISRTLETSDCFEKAVKSVIEVGYECVDETIFNGSLTTESGTRKADIPYDKFIDMPPFTPIKVTFNGVEYEVVGREALDIKGWRYGSLTGPNATPFEITSGYNSQGNLKNFIKTRTAGTYTVKIVLPNNKAETTACFKKAVKEVVGDVDKGYECENTELLSETVTTPADDVVTLSSQLILSEDILTITFDGVEYECPKTEIVDMMGTSNVYGGDFSSHDFSEYPFILQSIPSAARNDLWTKDAGTHTIKVGIQAVNTTECFEKAVKNVVQSGPVILTRVKTLAYSGNNYDFYDKTWQEVKNAFLNGQPIYLYDSMLENYISMSAYGYDGEEDVTADFAIFENATPPTVKKFLHLETFHLASGMPASFTEYDEHMVYITSSN